MFNDIFIEIKLYEKNVLKAEGIIGYLWKRIGNVLIIKAQPAKPKKEG